MKLEQNARVNYTQTCLCVSYPHPLATLIGWRNLFIQNHRLFRPEKKFPAR